MRISKRRLIETIDTVFDVCGLCNYTKGTKKIAIPWKKKIKKRHNGYEIQMRFPVGKSMHDVEKTYDAIVVALNGADIRLGQRNGWLVMDVYSEPLPNFYPFTSDLLEATRHTWKVPILLTQDGVMYHDFTVFPHLKIGGATRKGKTVAIKLITSILLINHPVEKMKMILLDGKRFASFAKYEHFPQVVRKGFDVKSTHESLLWVKEQLEERMTLLAKHDVEDIKEYEENYNEVLERYFVIVDEAFMFRVKDAKNDEDKIMRKTIESIFEELASLGAGPGFHLIFCTQRPDAETIPSLVRANIETCLAFRTANIKNSEVLLDHKGAYMLPDIRGRAIYQTDKEVVGQVPFLGNLRGWWLLFNALSIYRIKGKNNDKVEYLEPQNELESDKVFV